jgi:branched-chain amino acid transport system permease protein
MSSLTHITFMDVLVAIMLGVSLNLILGMAGQFSLGHAGFAAAGAYTAAVVAGKPEFFVPQLTFWHQHLGLSATLSFTCITITGMAAAVAVALVLGLIVGLPTLRLRGD